MRTSQRLCERRVAAASRGAYPAPDGELTFDKLSSVFLSGNRTRDDQPNHIQAATRALKEIWGEETVFIRSGGSIPIVGDFARHLGLPSVMMGFGLPDDNLHAPNEKFHLKNFELGIISLIRFLEEVGV